MENSIPSHIVDSHHHIWQLDTGLYSWLTADISPLYRDFSIADYQQVATQSMGATTQLHTVLVQASPTDEETDFLLAQAALEPTVTGVVGWVDFEQDSKAVCARLTTLAANNVFKGVRPMLQDIDDIDWVLRPGFAPIFNQLIRLNLSFDALCRVEHLPSIYQLAKRYPDLPIVIDHCAKPCIEKGQYTQWAAAIAPFSTLPNVYVKASGLTLEATKTQQQPSHFSAYFAHLTSIFGATRIMWGSDWPVVNINSDYAGWLGICQQLVASWDESDKARFWSGTAREFYNLGVLK
ncbi:amidohydrolase family protein [Alteromonas sp. 14N.309.X.WAT.G.H12]|uniref:amidohydrolase family protein n=1 Tax=Alteromonas sp. 14N.309.X.WAT.G.H12 TaxID=3120824 RepID=UPI002FD4516B